MGSEEQTFGEKSCESPPSRAFYAGIWVFEKSGGISLPEKRFQEEGGARRT